MIMNWTEPTEKNKSADSYLLVKGYDQTEIDVWIHE